MGGSDDDGDASPRTDRRRTMRDRLRSEPLRHIVAVLISALLASALTVVLVLTDALVSTPPDNAPELVGVAAPAVLSLFAFYGPAYLLLSRHAWRGLSGQRFRNALQRTAPPTKGLIRDLILGSPTQMSSTAALLSLGAVYFVASRPGATAAALLISLACVCGSWILVMASFSVEYAREWATSDGFRFPGHDELTYGDFLYLAAQTSTTYSSSDVTTQNRRARRLVSIHSLTAFVFATVILAFLVALVLNIISS